MTGLPADMQLHLVQSIDDLMEMKRWAGERRETPMGVDTESGGLSPWHTRLRTIQVGDKHHGWCVPWEQWGGGALEILNTYEGGFTWHNLPHDAKFMSVKTGWKVPWRRCDDTMIGARIQDPTRPAGLKPLTSKLVDKAAVTGQKLLDDGMKAQGWTWDTVPITFEPYWIYAAMDPVLNCHLWEQIIPDVQANFGAVYDLEMAIVRICTKMMIKGMRLDPGYIQAEQLRLSAFTEQAKAWLKREFGVTSVLSAGQISQALKRLGVEIDAFTDQGAPKMDKENLERYRATGGPQAAEMIRYVLAVRHATKLQGTYLDNFMTMADADGILHAGINTLAARTSRMSMSEPNLHNLPRDDKMIRGSFIPRDGNVFITCDLNQVEARLGAHFSEDEGLIKAFNDADEFGTDFFCGVAGGIYGEEITKKDRRRQLTKNVVYSCVPLDTKIVTRRGLLAHDEVLVGDETIGYDPTTGRSRWTAVTAVHHYDQAELTQISNRYQSYVTTPNHRWYGTVQTGSSWREVEERFFTTEEFVGMTRAILAAPFDGSAGPDISDDEAAVLGWMLSDGTLSVNYELGGNSQAGGAKRMVTGSINQSMKKHAHLIDELLNRVAAPHTRDKRDEYVVWRLSGPWVRDLIKRAGDFYDEWPNATAFALSLSRSQGNAMLNAMQLADGASFVKGKPWQIELVCALVYASGLNPREVWREPRGAWTKKRMGTVYPTQPRLTGQRLRHQKLEPAPVWCVTTELGTWTMQQGDVNSSTGRRLVLTGNSLYGAGTRKMAQTAGVPFEQMQPVADGFNATYPGLKATLERLYREAMERERPYIVTPMGRHIPLDRDRAFTQGLNSLIQGHAAEYFKVSVTNMEAAGIDDFLLVPVHDEIIADVPRDLAAEVSRLIEECMTNVDDYRVRMTAGADILTERWQKL